MGQRVAKWAAMAAGMLLATIGACVPMTDTSAQTPTPEQTVPSVPLTVHSKQPAPPAAFTLTPEQLARTDRVVAVFETSEQGGFAYIEALDDAGGYTCGSYALTSAHGEVLEVVKRWATLHPDSPLAPSLPTLITLAQRDSADVTALAAQAFPAAWKSEAAKPDFVEVYRSTFHDLIAFPAKKIMDENGAISVLAECVAKNLFNLHGFAEDPDGGHAILARATTKAGGTPASGKVTEPTWLGFVIDEMKANELHPQTQHAGLANAMKNGANRCDVLRSWIDNLPLIPPLDTLSYGIVIR